MGYDKDFDFTMTSNLMEDRTSITWSFSDHYFQFKMATAVLASIAEKIATKWVEENYSSIASKLDPQAIANLAIANSAAEVNKTLKEKIPDKVIEVVRSSETLRNLKKAGL